MNDFITVLTHGRIPLSKRWCADGTIQQFPHAKHFAIREERVGSFSEMAELLATVHTEPRSCIIRGKFTGGDLTNTVRQLDVFADTEHHWLLIDVDEYEPLEADPVLEPVESIEQYIHVHLPAEFHGASYHWQVSNSAGHPTKQGLRAHLWFWSETPHTSATLKAWAAPYQVDRSLFNPIQIHYTAPPVFDEGVTDPVPVRSGTVRKASDSVPLAATPAAPSDRLSRQQVARETLSTDPVAQLLHAKGLVKSERRNDSGLNIECPCSDRHSSESGESSTIYYPANTGGYAQRAFKCLHAGCTGAPQSEFLAALGYEEPSCADDFDDLSVENLVPGNVLGRKRFEFQQAAEFARGKRGSYLVKGILPQAGLGVIYGASSSGKTFFALDLVMAVSRGVPWRGLRVRQGAVAYICAEGEAGFRDRMLAFARAADESIALDLAVIPFHVLGGAPNFLLAPDVNDLVAAAKALGPLKVIVVDTFAQVMPGGNENAGEDVGKALANCRKLHQATGALVLLIHHSGKDQTKGARGWSGLRAAADVEIEVTRASNDSARVATVTKMKDGEDGGVFGFKLVPVVLGEDEDGDDIVSCVVRPSEIHLAALNRAAKPMSNYEQGAWNATFALSLGGGWVEEADVLDSAVSDGSVPCKEEIDPGSKKDRRRDQYRKALRDKLPSRGLIEYEGSKVRIVGKEA